MTGELLVVPGDDVAATCRGLLAAADDLARPTLPLPEEELDLTAELRLLAHHTTLAARHLEEARGRAVDRLTGAARALARLDDDVRGVDDALARRLHALTAGSS